MSCCERRNVVVLRGGWRTSLGMEASSPIEGSFSAFKRVLGDEPKTFAGVVQQHVRKDLDKHAEKRKRVVNSKVQAHDNSVAERRTDAVNECAKHISNKITEEFSETIVESTNYIATLMDVNDKMASQGITKSWSVPRRSMKNENNRRPPRVVVEINSKKHCTCQKDENTGRCEFATIYVEGLFLRTISSLDFYLQAGRVLTPSLDQVKQHLLAVRNFTLVVTMNLTARCKAYSCQSMLLYKHFHLRENQIIPLWQMIRSSKHPDPKIRRSLEGIKNITTC